MISTQQQQQPQCKRAMNKIAINRPLYGIHRKCGQCTIRTINTIVSFCFSLGTVVVTAVSVKCISLLTMIGHLFYTIFLCSLAKRLAYFVDGSQRMTCHVIGNMCIFCCWCSSSCKMHFEFCQFYYINGS